MKFKCVIPSLGRPEEIQSHPMLEHCHVVVVADQLAEYQSGRRRPLAYHVLPPTVKGLPATRNWILDNLWDKDEDFIWQVDDDLRYIVYMMTRSTRRLKDPDYMVDVIDHVGRAAMDAGTGLFTFALTPKPIERIPSKFIGLRGWASDHQMGIIDRELRFDENMRTRACIDISLQCLLKYRFLWKDLRWHFSCDIRTGTGGLVTSRTTEREQEAFDYLEKKWGKGLLKRKIPSDSNKDNRNNWGADSMTLRIN